DSFELKTLVDGHRMRNTHDLGGLSEFDLTSHLEERFGRNLDLTLVGPAKSAIKRRIAGALRTDIDLSTGSMPNMEPNSRGIGNLKEDDVLLYPCGMNAIFNVHRVLLSVRGCGRSIIFGFPYVDTLKILEKFGPGCHFY